MIKVGPRLWKTGLAVALTVFLLRVTGLRYEVFGAMAAVLAVAPSANQSLKNALELIGVNLLGGLIGAAATLLIGPNPLVMGGVVILVLLLCQILHWQKVSGTAAAVAIFVMAPHPEVAYAYVGWRLLAVVAGSVVGTAVNAFIARPDFWPAAAADIVRAGAELDRFTARMAERLDRPHSITKAEVLTGAARVEERIAEARKKVALLDERGPMGRELAERSLRVLSSLLERIQIVHKAALTAERLPDYGSEVVEIQAAIAALIRHRQDLYARLLAPMPLEVALAADLLAIERRFESAIRLPAQPEEAEIYFRLYRMRSSVSHMSNRLGRLCVAATGRVSTVIEAAAEAGLI